MGLPDPDKDPYFTNATVSPVVDGGVLCGDDKEQHYIARLIAVLAFLLLALRWQNS